MKELPGSIASNNALSVGASVAAGYGRHNWIFTAGLGYLRTGYEQTFTAATFDPLTGTAYNPQQIKATTYYQFITLPLSVGYQFHLSPKFALVPALGVQLSYYAGGKEKETENGSTHTYTISDENYHKVNIWVIGKVDVQYKISDRLFVFAGPATQVMLSNMINPPASATFKPSQRLYTYMIDAGITWSLHHK